MTDHDMTYIFFKDSTCTWSKDDFDGDHKNRTEVKLMRAVEEVRKLLVPSPEGEDDLKFLFFFN